MPKETLTTASMGCCDKAPAHLLKALEQGHPGGCSWGDDPHKEQGKASPQQASRLSCLEGETPENPIIYML